MGKRVFITGLGAIGATGHSLDDIWNALLAGEHGIEPVAELDNLPWKMAGLVKDLQPAKMLLDRKLAKVISRQDILGIYAATSAVSQSGLIPYRDALDCPIAFNESTAVFAGSPGNKYVQQYDFLPLLTKSQGDMRVFGAELTETVHPMWLLRILPNNVLAYTGITYGFKGMNHNIANHATGGTQALLEAWQAIVHGQAERAVVVAYDMGPEPQGLFYYDKLGVLSHRHLKPFDTERDGTILAEGAAAIVLESEDSVKARNAHCYAELVGGQSTTEGQGLFSLSQSGEALTSLLQSILEKAQLQPKDIGMITAHANGNPLSEDTEALAIQRTFGDYSIPVTGFKWSLGHTLCASGLMDTVLSCMALQTKTIPGIANLTQPAFACQALNLSAKARPLQTPAALIINRGFASMNAALVIKACD